MSIASVVSDSFDTTTLQGSQLGLSLLLPVNFPVNRECTLNNLFNIFPSEEINTYPKLRYFGVGIRGAYNADDGILSSAYNPAKTNMNLYSLIPIRCRPIDEDLSEAERANYRLRQRKLLKDGNEYFLYYLKTLTFGSEIKFKRINPLSGKEETYELNPEYLTPEPVKPDTSGTIESTVASIVAYCEATVDLEASEILEYIRVQYEGDTRWAKISELGFFTGIDTTVAGMTGQNVPINYTESIYTQLYNHSTWTGSPLTHEGMKIHSTFEICSDGAITSK